MLFLLFLARGLRQDLMYGISLKLEPRGAPAPTSGDKLFKVTVAAVVVVALWLR